MPRATRTSLPTVRYAKGVVDLTPERPPIDWDLAVRRYTELNWSVAMIARITGYKEMSIHNGLRKRGVKPRERRRQPTAHRRLRKTWSTIVRRVREAAEAGRPIVLARAWRAFEGFRAFAEQAGYRPGLVFVREDDSKGFTPANCRFVTRAEMGPYTGRPKRLVTAFGETKGVTAWARDPRCRVAPATLSIRLLGGMRPEDALTVPPSPGRYDIVPVPARARMKPRRLIDVEQARELYESGLNVRQVARKLGFEPSTMHSALVRAGVALRSPQTTTREGELLNKVWSQMRSHCRNPDDPRYRYHGARGVRVVPEWNRFAAFREWALDNGWKPGLCLVRLDDLGHYGPENCAFRSRSQTTASVRAPSRTRQPSLLVTAFGETKGLMAWSRDRRCKVSATVLSRRLRAGFRPEEALVTPPTKVGASGWKMITAFGETKAMADWLRDPRCKVKALGLRYRLEQGMDPEAAITTKPWRTTRRRDDPGGLAPRGAAKKKGERKRSTPARAGGKSRGASASRRTTRRR